MVEVIKVNVSITNISGERLWDISKPIPPIQINTNLNLVEIEKKSEDTLEVPFVLTVNYNPSVAQISMKGRAFVLGSKEEIGKIYSEYKEKKPPPSVLIQSICNTVFIESVILSKTLNVPPPIPLPQIPPVKESTGKKSSGVDYTA
ncbi:MAG: hypothetical protein QXJ63_02785 [Candidatus Bathyarchaeia archaeon]